MPETLMPFLTGLFLVFAGMLIGYFLWFRDRTQDMAIQSRLNRENSDLKDLIKQMKEKSFETDNELTNQKSKTHILQELCDDLVAGRERFQLDRVELETEIATKRKSLESVQEQLDEERRYRISLQDQLHEDQQKTIQQISGIENSWREKLASMQTDIVHSSSSFAQVEESNGRLTEQLHLAQAEIAQLKSELENQKSLLDTASQNASGLEKEYITLESAMRSHSELLKESRGQCAAALSAKNLAEQSVRDLRRQLEARTEEVSRLQELQLELESSRENSRGLEQAVLNGKHQLELISRERDKALEESASERLKLSSMTARLDNQESTIRQLRDKTAENLLRIQSEKESRLEIETKSRSQLNDLRGQLQERIREIELLRGKRDELTFKISELEELQTNTYSITHEQHENIQTQLKLLVSQRDKALDDVASLREEIARLRAEMNDMREQQEEQQASILSAPFGQTVMDEEYGGRTRRDDTLGVVYIEAPRFRDDLKLISGIAEVLEKRLNDFGVYTFKQIMEWDEKAVQEFCLLLTFKDRIDRDDWIGQARTLYFEKYKQQQNRRAA